MRKISLLVYACVMLFSVNAQARTITADVSIGGLYDLAEVILTGTVSSIEYATDEEGLPYTLYYLVDLDVLSGEYNGNEYILRIFGGIIERDVKYPNRKVYRKISFGRELDLEEGVRYTMFINGDGTGFSPVVAGKQGVFIDDGKYLLRNNKKIKKSKLKNEIKLYGKSKQKLEHVFASNSYKNAVKESEPAAFYTGFGNYLRPLMGEPGKASEQLQVNHVDLQGEL